MFVAGNPFQPSIMISSKTEAYPRVEYASKEGAHSSKAPLRCSTLVSAPGLTRKHQTTLESLTRDKHSSLSSTIMKLQREMFFFVETAPGFGSLPRKGETELTRFFWIGSAVMVEISTIS